MSSPALSAARLQSPKWLTVPGHWLASRMDLSGLNTTRWTLAGVIAITGFALALLGAKAIEALQAPHPDVSPMTPTDVTLVLERLREQPLFAGTSQRPAHAKKPSFQPSPWTLQGLFSGSATTEGSAILSNGGQPAVLARSGTLLADGTRLLEVHRDRVILQRPDASKHILQLSPPGSPISGRNQAASTLALKPAAVDADQPLGAGNPDDLTERRARIRQRLETLRQRARDGGSGRS